MESVNLDSIINKDGIVLRWPKKKEEKNADILEILTNGYPITIDGEKNKGWKRDWFRENKDVFDRQYLDPFEYNGLHFATVNYCYKCSIYEKEEGKPHTGVDLFGAKGTPIYSMIRGEVWATSFMGDPREGGHGGTSYGRVMLIKGDNGKLYLLAHLSEYKKQKGAPVFPNEIVALARNTGDSQGDHLHLEVFECDNSLEKKNVINIDADENVEMRWIDQSEYFLHTKKRVNPFNHNEYKG